MMYAVCVKAAAAAAAVWSLELWRVVFGWCRM
jgi:hypothetical protein